jgi:hypothetical protein
VRASGDLWLVDSRWRGSRLTVDMAGLWPSSEVCVETIAPGAINREAYRVII